MRMAIAIVSQADGTTLDPLSKHDRSERMSRIRCRDTKPERRIRSLVYSLGYRYRLHYQGLPGKPDLVFKGRKKVIFVHGCFWHRHRDCPNDRPPKSRLDFWLPKLNGNAERDERVHATLRKMGWDIMVVWECETLDVGRICVKIENFLGGRH
jgi:DNA mismatch endonuclease (patch repair protein)